MRADGVADVAREDLRALLRAAAGGGDGHAAPSPRSSRSTSCPTPTSCPTTRRARARRSRRPSSSSSTAASGTSMGMTGPKSLLEVKDGLTFLDITVHQIRDLRERTGARLPLVLMNSLRDARRVAGRARALRRPAGRRRARRLPAEQGAQARRRRPARRREWPDDPALEWAPPGHGDLYPSLLSSGLLDALLDGGYRYAFVANVDNLGAVLEPRILAWFAREQIPFLMEVADRTAADRKGGHLARRAGGTARLVLREIAQTPEEDVDAFQDTSRHRFFNTNTLWIDLRALRRRAARARRRARAADDRQPQDGRPGRRRLDAGHPARDRDGRGDRRLRRRARDPRRRASASRRSRRPTTCSRCARTPTS